MCYNRQWQIRLPGLQEVHHLCDPRAAIIKSTNSEHHPAVVSLEEAMAEALVATACGRASWPSSYWEQGEHHLPGES
jgi:hypothetical protein